MLDIKKYHVIDCETGEVVNKIIANENQRVGLINNEDYQAAIEKIAKEENKLRFIRNKNNFEKHCSDLGGFVHMIYLKNEILFNNTNIDKANISRIIFLSTYMNYNDGLLVKTDSIERNKKGEFLCKDPLTRAEIQELLELSSATFSRFLKDMKDNNILIEENKTFKINRDYFIKGELGAKLDKDKEYCRLYISTIRQLYKGCKTSQHKILSNVFQLIPYIHYDSNILSHTTSSNEEINPLSLDEVYALLGYKDEEGKNSSNKSKLVNNLIKFKVRYNEEDYHLISYSKTNFSDEHFIINPLVIYKGNNLEIVSKICRGVYFREKKKRKSKEK